MAKTAHPQPLRRTRQQVVTRTRMRWVALFFMALAIALIWIIYVLWGPVERKTVIITAGANGGIYQTFARRYAASLAQDAIALDVRTSSGAVENYQRLKDPNSPYDIGLVQSGTGNARDAPELQTLASVSFEPIWIFYRGTPTIERLSQLTGKHIGIGQPGSGLHTVMLSLLSLHGVNRANTALEEFTAATAAKALRNGQLDAAAFIGAPDIPVIENLLQSDLHLINMSQADTIVRRFPSLTKVIFPRGAIDLARDLPPQDITLLSTTALLVAKKTLPTEVAYKLLDAAIDVHGIPSFFADRGEFPNQHIEDFPISDDTRRYFKNGRPFLQKYLPFALANFIEQRFVILLPGIAVFFALLQTLPRLYAYRMRSRLARWYHEIKLLEDEMLATTMPDLHQRQAWQRELAVIDASVGELTVPEAFIRDTYALKHAIRMVADRIGAACPPTLVPGEPSRII